jgi:glutathione-regulated potassium-efflux system ancillary protein KefG
MTTTSKILVIVAHPNLNESRINKRLAAELDQRENVTVHRLYEAYPDEVIDVERERQLMEAHDRIVLQRGWAYGTGGDKLQGKDLLLAISTGGRQDDYQPGGNHLYTHNDLQLIGWG